MSKIGKLPVHVREGVQVTIADKQVQIAGPKGNFSYTIPQGILVSYADNQLQVTQQNANDVTTRAMFGLVRANLANMVKGVESGFEKKLELSGVGYRGQMQGEDLVLSLGFSHPVKFRPKPGIKLSVAENVITVSGADKMLVGEMAAEIRKVKEPEPYKGKGIKYVGERIRRKAGKAAKAVGGK